MEAMFKKFQQKYNKAREDMDRWDEHQTRLLSQFRNASSIIQRLPVLQDMKNYDSLRFDEGLQKKLLSKQMDSLQTIMMSMKMTLDEFRGVTTSLEKLVRDGRQLIKGGTSQQIQQHIGVKPSLAYCVQGIETLHDMYLSEYKLKLSLYSALCPLTFKSDTTDLSALQQLLVDQPNISKEEVDSLFDIIFPENH